MSAEQLQRETWAQLWAMAETVCELGVRAEELAGGPPHTKLELAGFGALLMNLYAGMENILKRIAQAEGIDIPGGPKWHAELFRRFEQDLPSTVTPFFLPDDAQLLRPFRNFRHVAIHNYGVALRWEMMVDLVDSSNRAFAAIVSAANRYLAACGGAPPQPFPLDPASYSDARG